MAGWADGYVADVPYRSGCYREQSLFHLSLAALLGNVDSRPPSPDDAVQYLELGCGKGLNALLIAASNPGWQVTAVDFNPSHIADARAVAKAAGLSNLRFLEASFGDMTDRSLGQADIVSMHGVWSWISPSARADIVRLLARSVAPGGLVHLSYNSLPALQGALGLQRLIYEAGRRMPGRSDRQVQEGLNLARDLLDVSAYALSNEKLPRELLESAASHGMVDYLAHEYMNAHWLPCFHADVTAALSDAKLEWAASASLLDAFPEIMMTGPQRAVHDRYDDPIMRELIKDSCQPRQLRHDLFVRGIRRINNAERDTRLADLTVGLTVPADSFRYHLIVPAGKAAMGDAFRLYVDALRTGPKTVRELMSLAPERSNPAEIAAMLVGTQQAQLVPRPGLRNAPAGDRLNALFGADAHGLVGQGSWTGIASAALGAGLPVARMTQFLCARLLNGEDESAQQRWFEELSVNVAEDKRSLLRQAIDETLRQQIPMLRTLGILPD
jgi:SAM-dependent methyltransferase